MPGPLVHRLLDNKRRIDKHLSDYGNTVKFLIFFSLVSNIFWQGDHCHFSSGRDLPVNSWMTACNVFLDMSVNSSYKMCELFNCFIKCPVWPFIETVTFRIVDDEAVKMSPVVIEILYKTCKFIKVLKENLRLIKNMGNNTAFIFDE